MNKFLIVYIALFLFAAGNVFGVVTTLSGKVTEKITGEPLPGVTVYIPELKTGAVTDLDGFYRIENLPMRQLTVQVSFVGFKLIIQQVNLEADSVRNFEMEEAIAELHEVVVTGLSKAAERNRTPTPITTIPQIQLQQAASSNLIDAISRQPGISQVTTGQGISKPVIRGLGFNRVVVVIDGIRQEGQQWGDEHGIEIDEFSVNRVEILKGPGSLAYGSDAMAGVINFINAPTLPQGKIDGGIITNYQTNNGLYSISTNIAGNLKGVIWDIRYSNKNAHSYRNKTDGLVFNSAFKEQAVSGIAGINKSWGYSHLHFSLYHMSTGIVEGERDSLSGKFLKPVSIGVDEATNVIASHDDLISYSVFTPHQDIDHFKTVINNSIAAGAGNIKLLAGWQQNRRQEFGDIFNPDSYGLYFLLNTFNYDVAYNFTIRNATDIAAGINGMYQLSENRGTEFLVPEYNLFDAGIYIIYKRNFEKLDVNGGVRYDHRTENGSSLFINDEGIMVPEGMGSERFKAFSTDFSGVSGSVGLAYQLSDAVYSKFNVSRGYRSPNIAELASNGEHEGTGRYEKGNLSLKPENSIQVDAALGFNSHHITAELNLFSNSINNFIYSAKLNAVNGTDSIIDDKPVFLFTSGNALLAGGEITIDMHPHPLDWLHFENTFSYVHSRLLDQPSESKYLPLTPPAKLTSDLRGNFKNLPGPFLNSFIKAGIEYYFAQHNVYRLNNTETPTPGYVLLNAGVGSDVKRKNHTFCSIFISITNLADISYQNHLNRLKYAPRNFANGRTGVFNMGRNVSFKLIFPLGFKT
jgi:iron complex outermembrane recepter protein